MTVANSIKDINESARKFHGKDIFILVARAVAFGHDDNLIIVQGKKHAAAAADFARTIKGARVTQEETSDFNGGKKIQSLIAF